MTDASRIAGAHIPASRDELLRRLWRSAPVALVLAVALLQCATLMSNADVAWYATVLDKLAGGGRLYVDVFETNPRFAVYLYWPASVLAHWLNVRTEWANDALVFALGGISLLLCRTILLGAGLAITRWTMPHRAALLAILFVLPAATFGEREHVALIAVLPFLCVEAARATGRPPRLGAALGAGVLCGLALLAKPHVALGVAPAVLVAMVATRTVLRPLRAPECLMAGGIALAYAALVVIADPDFVERALPLILTAYVPVKYDAATFLQHFIAIETSIAALLGAALVVTRGRPTCLQWAALAAAVGFYAAVVLQGKGMPYHFYPAVALALFVAVDAGFASDWRSLRDMPMALVLAVVVFGYGWSWFDAGFDMRKLVEPVRQVAAHPRVIAIGYDFSDGPPVVQAVGGEWVGSVASQWATDNAHWLVANRAPDAAGLAALTRIEAWDRDLLAADIRRGDPDVILIQRGPEDWLPWARRSPEIAAALDRYEPTGRYPSGGIGNGTTLDIELWRKTRVGLAAGELRH